MRRIWQVSALFVTVCLLACAPYRQLSPLEMEQSGEAFVRLLGARKVAQENSAYLAQVRVKTPKLKKKFRLEIFCEADSISFYSPGFMGKGTFKGIIKGDSLRFYLPGENAYFSGLWYELTEPKLGRWGDIFLLIRGMMCGIFLPFPDSADDLGGMSYEADRLLGENYNWRWIFGYDGRKFRQASYEWRKDSLIARLKPSEQAESFPFFKLARLDVYYQPAQSRDDRSEIKIEFIEQKYNLRIPPEKFELEIPSEAEKIEVIPLE